MAVRQLNKEIKMMLVKRKSIKAIFFEADRLIKRTNIAKNKPKTKRRLVASQEDLDTHQKTSKQMTRFRNFVLHELTEKRIGANAFESLGLASVEPAIEMLIAWGKENNIPAQFIQHEVESQRKELAARTKLFNITKGA